MSEQVLTDGPLYVQLFQKAHQKIQFLERIEEQLQPLLVKRQELQEELRGVQEEINGELVQRLNRFPSPGRTSSAPGNHEVGGRFAAQSLTSLSPEE